MNGRNHIEEDDFDELLYRQSENSEDDQEEDTDTKTD